MAFYVIYCTMNEGVKNMKVVSVKERPELLEEITLYFINHWANEESKMVYVDCIKNALYSKNKMSNWYVLLDDNRIIGSAGMISNDFVSRMDLYPYLCALYIEKDYRGHNYGKLLIDRIKKDTISLGFDFLYLVTDHIGYYEHFDFEKIGTGYHPWGETSSIYRCNLKKDRRHIISEIESLIDPSIPFYSNLANISCILKDAFPNTLWAGFYLSNKENELVLGPYQGPLACTIIPYNRGVCGISAYKKETLIVPNVHEFTNHIACSSLSNSEIVVPIIKDNIVVGVIDLDSIEFDNFSKEDALVLEEVASLISRIL